MFIVKNALRCIGRSKGRNILIGVIVLVIAVSACIGLSIRQAAENAKAETLGSLSVTATISFDRQSMMNNMTPPSGEGSFDRGDFDRDSFAEQMQGISSLAAEDYAVYAAADSVSDFYYTLSVAFDGTDMLSPVTTDTSEEFAENIPEMPDMSEMGDMGGMGGMGGMMMGRFEENGDFTLIGYSSDAAMTDFANGTASVTEGAVFEEATAEPHCLVSEELAAYNGLAVGDVITVANPNNTDEVYELTITGIYTAASTNDFSMSRFGAGEDPANRIYMSAEALSALVSASESVSVTATDEDTGREYETALTAATEATYVFADTNAYYRFEEEARALGLSEEYTVSSTDVTAYENSLTPLNTLSTMAGWFLLVILLIGAIILMVLNIFNVRERKYEIGVLTAMGMKKRKVALQFMTEILVVTMVAVLFGAVLGAVSSVPVTNALLANQIESQTAEQTRIDQSFGRPGNMGGMGGDKGNTPSFGGDNTAQDTTPPNGFFDQAADYIREIDSAMNLTVVLQMLGIGLLLTLVAGAVSVLFVMRYDPLKILANRD